MYILENFVVRVGGSVCFSRGLLQSGFEHVLTFFGEFALCIGFVFSFISSLVFLY